MFPLLSAPMNTKLKVLKSGSGPRMSKHLESLGLGEGSVLTLLQERDGDVIVRVMEGESCLALDQEVARSRGGARQPAPGGSPFRESKKIRQRRELLKRKSPEWEKRS